MPNTAGNVSALAWASQPNPAVQVAGLAKCVRDRDQPGTFKHMFAARAINIAAAAAFAIAAAGNAHAAEQLTADIAPAVAGKTVGIGSPFEMTLDTKVTSKRARNEIARATTVKAGQDHLSGYWWWPNNKTARFVPDSYWPGNATITISVNFDHVDTKRRPSSGTTSATMRTSEPIWAKVKGKKQRMLVYRGDKKIRTIDVSTGKKGNETRVGTKLIMDRRDGYTLRGPASDPYVIPVDYAMRITNSGEIIHSAPWATHRLGEYPGSGGCTNTSVADARWLYKTVNEGTPVEFVGTGGELQTPTNGWGDWNVPQEDTHRVIASYPNTPLRPW